MAVGMTIPLIKRLPSLGIEDAVVNENKTADKEIQEVLNTLGDNLGIAESEAEKDEKEKDKEDKVTGMFEKLRKTKFFQKSIGLFKKMVSTNWIMCLVKALLFLAIFDPKGKFLSKAIDWIIKGVVWVVNFIAKKLPEWINRGVKYLGYIIPKLIGFVLYEVIPMIGRILTSFGKALKGTIFGDILTFAGSLFADGGLIQKALKFMIENFQLFLTLLISYKLFMMSEVILEKLTAIHYKFMYVKTLVSTVFSKIYYFLQFLYFKARKIFGIIMGKISAILLIKVLIFVGIIIIIGFIIFLLIKYRREIGIFFRRLWDGIVSIALSIGQFFNKYFIKPISDAFTWVIENVIKPAWNFIKGIGSTIWDGISGIFNSIIQWFRDLWRKLLNIFRGKTMGERMREVMENIPEFASKNIVQNLYHHPSVKGLEKDEKDKLMKAVSEGVLHQIQAESELIARKAGETDEDLAERRAIFMNEKFIETYQRFRSRSFNEDDMFIALQQARAKEEQQDLEDAQKVERMGGKKRSVSVYQRKTAG